VRLLWWIEASFPHFLLDGFAAGPPVSVLITVFASAVVYFAFAFLTGGLDRPSSPGCSNVAKRPETGFRSGLIAGP
jgi:hypothetical protein